MWIGAERMGAMAGERLNLAVEAILFREGEPSDGAYLIESGQVGVSRIFDGAEVTLTSFGPGEIVGEMGLVSEKVRGTTMRALEPTTVLHLQRDRLLETLQHEGPAAAALLRLLLEQLRQGNKRVRPRASTVTACLRPLTPQAREALGQESLLIQSFPFRIGRRSDDRLAFNELQLDDRRPYQISRNHVLLSLEQGVLTIQDRGSSLGTWVRGQLLGGASSFEGPVLVHDGSVELVLGHSHSPMRFRLEVLPLTDPDAGG